MDRRRFLELTAAAGATGAITATTLLAGCGGGSSSSGVAVTPPVVPPVSAGPDWQGLASKMQGSLIRPGTALYEQARVTYNARFDAILPQAVARCTSAADVSAVLAFARDAGLAVTPRSGGHGFAGYSTGTGVVIDVGLMNTITVSGATATIGAGAKLVDVYDQLTAKGVAIPTGSCESVGIAGITMGGGIGIVDRAYGLTCDNLISAQIVTADGKLLNCDASTEPDLFWAIRGGGGGNFGIVTSFTFKTHATSDITTARATFSMDDALKVMAAWQAWPQTLPDTIWGQIVFGWDKGASVPYISLLAVCVGGAADLTPHWNRLLAAIASSARNISMTTSSYRDTMLGSCGGLSVSECHIKGQTPDSKMNRTSFASTSDFFDAVVPDAGIQALRQSFLNNFASYSSASPDGSGAYWIFDLMGGAISQIAANATAFVHRNALFSAEYYNVHPVGVSSTTLDSEQAAANKVRSVMKQWSSGGAYVNYIDPLLTDWQTAYYGSNFAKLVQVKAKYDPSGVFRMAQGIPLT